MPIDYRTIIDSEVQRLAEVLEQSPTAGVPTCGEWTVADLVAHTSRVHRMAAASLRGDELVNGYPPTVAFDPSSCSLADYLTEGLVELNEALDITPATDEVWTFVGTRPASFWTRRMAAETAVHRWDAENAVGDARPFEADHAVDMIDEFFDVYVGRKPADAFADPDGRTLHLHATDAEGEWVITRHPDHIEIEHAHAKSTTAVRGGASSLLLVVWNRPVQPDVEVFGDASQLQDWQQTFSF